MKKENNEEMQRKIMEINILENRLVQLEQQFNLIDQKVMEQQLLQMNLDELKKSKSKEMLLPLGNNVFISGKVENPEIFVNVGARVIVKKDTEKAKEIIERQKMSLVELRDEIGRQIEESIQRISLIERTIKQ